VQNARPRALADDAAVVEALRRGDDEAFTSLVWITFMRPFAASPGCTSRALQSQTNMKFKEIIMKFKEIILKCATGTIAALMLIFTLLFVHAQSGPGPGPFESRGSGCNFFPPSASGGVGVDPL
jgi:hypothetical protein